MNIYKANLKKDFYFVLLFLGLLAVTILLTSKLSSNGALFFTLFCFVFLLYSFLTVRLSEIQIDPQTKLLVFIYKNYLKITKKVNYNLDKIEFTYKKQAVSLRSGALKNVCSIYKGDKRIIQIIPTRDGWDDDEVNDLVQGLIQAGIKKKFVGYSLKDVET
jgi:Ca2+/Na+ antiporter